MWKLHDCLLCSSSVKTISYFYLLYATIFVTTKHICPKCLSFACDLGFLFGGFEELSTLPLFYSREMLFKNFTGGFTGGIDLANTVFVTIYPRSIFSPSGSREKSPKFMFLDSRRRPGIHRFNKLISPLLASDIGWSTQSSHSRIF